MEQIRAFIAIELPDEVKLALGRLEAKLKAGKQSGVRWVEPDSIHLTLQFLGDIPADSTGEITGAIEEASRAVPPFHLEVKDLGAFPNLKRVQVIWVGIRGEIDKLAQLQKSIESNLEILGFAPETRPFTPHLTLGRVQRGVSSEEQQKLGQLIAATGFEAGIIKVEAVNLMRSELTRAGAIHSLISMVKLPTLANG